MFSFREYTCIANHSLLLKQMTSYWKHIIICLRLLQEFDTLLDCTFQEGTKLKILKINTIQIYYGVSIDHTYHIIKTNM